MEEASVSSLSFSAVLLLRSSSGAKPDELTRLALITESVIVTRPPVVLMPPPLDVAWFLMILLDATFSVPWLEMPPPATAELPLTVQLVSAVVQPELSPTPPTVRQEELPP